MAYTDEQRQTILTMLKYNLELILDYMDAEARTQKETQLGYYIDTAISLIETEGVTLDYSDTSDCMLIVMYASYLYEKRNDGVSVMPRALRYALNIRLFKEKAAIDEG